MPKTAANKNNITAMSIKIPTSARANGAGERGKEPECWETKVVEVAEG
jgi:hypothetical protein